MFGLRSNGRLGIPMQTKRMPDNHLRDKGRRSRYRRYSGLVIKMFFHTVYRKLYEGAVNALGHNGGGREGKAHLRKEIKRLRLHYQILREQEIEVLKKSQE